MTRSGEARTGRQVGGGAGQDVARHGSTRQARHGLTRQDKARPDKAGLDEAGMARSNKARHDPAVLNVTRQAWLDLEGQTRPGQTWQAGLG
jgi:hypothetical protein